MKFFVSWICFASVIMSLLLYGSSYGVKKGFGETDKLSAWKIAESRLPELEKKEEKPFETLQISVYNKKADAYMDMPIDEYLYGVLLAEIPSSFEDEALKAQAVAARTLILYKLSGKFPEEHPHSAVCTSSGHCMAYISPEDYVAAAANDEFARRVRDAVQDTKGQIVTYGGEPVMAVFHSSSYSETADSAEQWSCEYPYLKSVSTPEQYYPDYVKNLITEKIFTVSEFYGIITKEYPELSISASSIKDSFKLTKTASGRTASIKIGDCEIKGTKLRKMLSLRSTDFTVSFANQNVIFKVKGYGHGVGMSQYGANIMAKQGLSYKEILAHYYTDTELSYLENNF